jgi:hypothetical protein
MNKKRVTYLDLRVLSDFHRLSSGETRELADEVDPDNKQDVQWMLRRYIQPLIRILESKCPGF